jgi:type IV secretory pathway TraG/TraD family ATPase VirD4
MSSRVAFSEHQQDPWSALGGGLEWLAHTVLQFGLGVVFGLLAARYMRRGHLHWTWAPAMLAFVLCVHGRLGSFTFTLICASVVATVRSRRWHREDIDSGADLAEIAAQRSGPVDYLRTIATVLEERSGVRAGVDGPDTQTLALGRDERGRKVAIPFGEQAGARHMLVVGATGSGKTVTQTLMAVNAIERGMGAVVVDPKGDRGMSSELRRAAQATGRRFLEWTPAGACVFNPYAHGSETEIADKLLAGERFTEPHYQRQAQRYLGHVVRVLRAADIEVSLAAVVAYLDPDRLELLVRGLPEGEARATQTYLDSLSSHQRRDLAGVRDRLAILVESDVGPWLDPQTPDVQRFDLQSMVRERAIVYFNLEADSRPLLAQMLGASIVQDLQSTVAALQGNPIATLVVIDEFSALAAERVVGLFARARSAGISLLLATQELSDLRLPGREMLLEQVMGNLSVVIAHRQVVPESAALISSISGRHGVWKVSRRSDGATTRTRIRESVLNPDRIAGLGQGWAAVIVLGGAASVRITRVSRARSATLDLVRASA